MHYSDNISFNLFSHSLKTFCMILVKNLFYLHVVYVQVFRTRLTPVVKMPPFLQLTFPDKNGHAAFLSFVNKESGFAFRETREGVVTLIHFFRCYQLMIVANQLLLIDNFFIATFSMLGPKSIVIAVIQI